MTASLARLAAVVRTGVLLVVAGVVVGLGAILPAEAAPAASPSASPAVAPPPAHPPTWRASLTPKKGLDTDIIELTTSGGCADPAHNVLGRIYGHGFEKVGTVVVGNTQADVQPGAPFTVSVFLPLREVMFMQDEPVPFEGTYRLELACRRVAQDASYGNYVARIRFTDAHTWTALPPVTKAHGPLTDDPSSDEPGAYSPGSAGDDASAQGGSGQGGASSGDAGSGGTGSASGAGTESSEAEATQEAASVPSGSGLGPVLLIGAGLVVAVVAVVVATRRGEKPTA